jgi:hypothetical protein
MGVAPASTLQLAGETVGSRLRRRGLINRSVHCENPTCLFGVFADGQIAQQLQAVESAIESAKKALIHDHVSDSIERSFKGRRRKRSGRAQGLQADREISVSGARDAANLA